MEKKLEGLKWEPRWVTHLGAVRGCLNYLDINISDPWLYGATGYAFVLNIMKENLCPSGPTAWNTQMVFMLGRNLGYQTEGVCGTKFDDDFDDKQKQAWEVVKKAIDDGLPCYGWELKIPEYYVINGYTETGYLFQGVMTEPEGEVLPWQSLGTGDTSGLEVFWVKKGETNDELSTFKQALAFALEISRSPARYIFEEYQGGPQAYEYWHTAIAEDKANQWGAAYNPAVWSECRQMAVEFLKEAKQRFSGKCDALFDEGIEYYGTVSQKLKRVCSHFPFPPKQDQVLSGADKESVIHYLKQAKRAEEKGLGILEEILVTL